MTDTTPIPMQAVAEIDAQPADDDTRLWSVTTILKAIGSDEGLIEWSAQESARTAIRSERTWKAILADQDEDAAVAWIAGGRFRPAKGERSATKLGSAVHACCELYVVTGVRPALGTNLGEDLGKVDAELTPYLDSFELYLERFSPSYTAAEFTVFDTQYGYAGTADGTAHIEGVHSLIDYKTSKKSWGGRDGKTRRKPWNDVALQMAAYRWAEFAAVWRARRYEQWSRRYYLLNGAETDLAVPVPATEGGIVIHITPEHCDVYPVDCGKEVHLEFLYSIEAARWEYERSRNVIGEALALLDKKGR
jgi:hypothetical protein